jgi:hypothetical protein
MKGFADNRKQLFVLKLMKSRALLRHAHGIGVSLLTIQFWIILLLAGARFSDEFEYHRCPHPVSNNVDRRSDLGI